MPLPISCSPSLPPSLILPRTHATCNISVCASPLRYCCSFALANSEPRWPRVGQLELMRLEQEQLRRKQEQERLKRRLARPHSAHASTQRKDFELDDAWRTNPFELSMPESSPRQPFALSSPPSSRRELVAGGGFGFSPTAVSTASTVDSACDLSSQLAQSPGRCAASRASAPDAAVASTREPEARPSTAAAARTAASSIQSHKAWSTRSPRTPEKKRIRLTHSQDVSDPAFLSVPGKD